MAYDSMVEGGLDYQPCRYGASKVLFRGPEKRLDGTHVAVIGGTETYGKLIAHPYPDLLEDALGRTCVNFGCVNAGVDVFAADGVVQQACREAALTVVQLTGAQNMSNRFYSVHPRRNDRFLKPSPALRVIYPQVDFAEISFTGHLLRTLEEADPARFELVRDELRQAWTARMRGLVRRIGPRVVLLWMSERRPEERAECRTGREPLFVTRAMLDELCPDVLDLVEVVADRPSAAHGTAGMVFAPLQESAAADLPGPEVHAAVADALTRRLADHL